MTKTDSKDPFDTVEAIVVGVTENAFRLRLEDDREAWIPRSLFSYVSEETAEANVMEMTLESYEIRRWKLRALGWL